MAAIHDPMRQLDLSSLAAAMQKNLPRFAQPLFLRLVTSGLEATGTFKLKKFALQREGFDPDVAEPAGDDVFFLDPATMTYQPLSGDVYRSINSGEIRL